MVFSFLGQNKNQETKSELGVYLCQQSAAVNMTQTFLSEHSSNVLGLQHWAWPLNVCTMYSVMFERTSLLPLYSGAAQR